MKRIGILGGGASALMCACFASENVQITIIEKSTKVGKKILATGNGRCNLTNVNMNKYSYNQNLDKYINRFTIHDTLSFFNKIGLEVYADDEGRVYPLSNSAQSVLDVLKNAISLKKNIKIVENKEFIDIFINNNLYAVKFADGSFEYYDNVVVASGNGTNLSVLDKFNIKYKEFLPSLCSLNTDSHKNLGGVRVSGVGVSCEVNKEKFYEEGEILFKEDGLSGIVIFNLSSFMSRKNCFKCDVFIDFLPKITQKDLFLLLFSRKQNLQKYKIKDFLTGLFNKPIAELFLSKLNVNYDDNVSKLNDDKIELLAKTIKNYKIKSYSPSTNNQVCSGGVVLKELDDNLQSINNPGLFFIGEVIDVDGMCGGYNLQWAWTSGKIVGESL